MKNIDQAKAFVMRYIDQAKACLTSWKAIIMTDLILFDLNVDLKANQ